MDHPISLIVTDDLRRRRLTVFFRFFLAIPHAYIGGVWGALLVAPLVFANWFRMLVTGRSSDWMQDQLGRWLRYSAQTNAYFHLLSEPFPVVGGAEGYPFDVEIGPPEPQNRLTILFRLVLAIPAVIILYVLNAVVFLVAVFGWFVCLFLARMPEGMRNIGVFCLRYQTQTYAYLMLLTARYPSLSFGESSSPVTAGP